MKKVTKKSNHGYIVGDKVIVKDKWEDNRLCIITSFENDKITMIKKDVKRVTGRDVVLCGVSMHSGIMNGHDAIIKVSQIHTIGWEGRGFESLQWLKEVS